MLVSHVKHLVPLCHGLPCALFPLIWCSTNKQHWQVEREERPGGAWVLLATLPVLGAALSFAGDLRLHDFFLLHGRQFGPDAWRLAVVGLGGGVVALHARVLVDVSIRWSQCGLAAWGVLYFLPPPLFAAVVGDVGLMLGVLLRVAFAGWAVGYLLGVMEESTQREARHLEAAAVQRSFGLGLPRLRVIGFGGLAAMMLALGELTVSARLAQPGDDPLAVSLLSALHYQRPGWSCWRWSLVVGNRRCCLAASSTMLRNALGDAAGLVQ